MKTVRAYLELVRLPNTFTAMADALAGYWLIAGPLQWSWQIPLLALASASIYAAGIVFNDLRDIETDRRERPERPLPSGRVTKKQAIVLAVALSIIGVCLAGVAGFVGQGDVDVDTILPDTIRPGLVSVALLAAVLAYNFLFKGTLLGPLTMGLCRGLNLIMALSLGWWFTFDMAAIAVVAMVHYTASFTYFGLEEVGQSKRFRLVTGGLGVVTAVLLLGMVVAGSHLAGASANGNFTLILWLAFLIHVTRIAYRAMKNPVPAQVQYAMKTFILGIVVFDATLAAAAQGWIAGMVVLALLVPALLIGRWIYST